MGNAGSLKQLSSMLCAWLLPLDHANKLFKKWRYYTKCTKTGVMNNNCGSPRRHASNATSKMGFAHLKIASTSTAHKCDTHWSAHSGDIFPPLSKKYSRFTVDTPQEGGERWQHTFSGP
uniref:Putative secreted protein n=1 Tax=Amblyomma triste TaxID=251400 RepID=A0A023G0N8_AMBTT